MQQGQKQNLIWAVLMAVVMGCAPASPVMDMSSAPDLAARPDLTAMTDMATPAPLYTWPRYFSFPFEKAAGAVLTQAWILDEPELPYHPTWPQHYANDFKLPRGTKLYAPAPGYILCSYEVQRIDGIDPTTGAKIKIGIGRGLFCQILHPDMYDEYGNVLYTILAHLSKVANESDYRPPAHVGAKGPDDWSTNAIFRISPEMMKTVGRFVKEGDEIGEVGFTGLGIGYGEQPSYPPAVPNDDPTWTWDPAKWHVHSQVITRDPKTYAPKTSIDPLRTYRQQFGDAYSDVFEKARGLMKANADGSPKFAR